jgi:hypothetical protein
MAACLTRETGFPTGAGGEVQRHPWQKALPVPADGYRESGLYAAENPQSPSKTVDNTEIELGQR